MSISASTPPRTPKKNRKGQADGEGQFFHWGSLGRHVWGGATSFAPIRSIFIDIGGPRPILKPLYREVGYDRNQSSGEQLIDQSFS